ncbi:MAG: SDR family oxidoreductase [Blastocatellia bacterium]|nr:SDR family oxidoreductase [Blastocatellia bacterium]
MPKVLITGATGQLGQAAAARLKAAGFEVRALARRPEGLRGVAVDEPVTGDLTKPETLVGICQETDVVLSCAGASMNVNAFGDRRSFYEVDYQGNINLLREAARAGVGKFVYVSLAGGESLRRTVYADAHERFVDDLRASGIPSTVVRPTGFFSFHLELLKFASKGRGLVIGDGERRTNPVHEVDVAAACVEAATRDASDRPDLIVGGPEVFTRRETVEMAFAALGRKPSLMTLSPGVFSAMISPLKLINRRIHALMDFGIAVTQQDLVAPAYGAHRLQDYYEQAAKAL